MLVLILFLKWNHPDFQNQIRWIRNSSLKHFLVMETKKQHIRFVHNHVLSEPVKNKHERQNNHKCNSCGKCFTKSANLNNHSKKIHKGQRN